MPAPLVAAALTGAALGAAERLPDVLPTLLPSAYKKRNREQLEALLAREKAGKLGLTSPEEYALMQQHAGALGASRAAADAATRDALAGGGAGFGAGAQAAAAAQESAARLAGAARSDVAAADYARTQEQKAEIEQRMAVKEAERLADIKAVMDLAAGSLRGVQMGLQQGKTINPGTPPPGGSTGTPPPGGLVNPLGNAATQRTNAFITQGYAPDTAASMAALDPSGQSAMAFFMGDAAPTFGTARF
jgi:hypothetical protein